MKKHLILAGFLLLTASFTGADSRTSGLDFVIVYDKSLSMADKIERTRIYVAENILTYAEPGDSVTPIVFYGKAEILDTVQVTSETDKAQLLRRIQSYQANGRFTDIGNALDALDSVVKKLADSGRRKYLVMLTDEKQEAPPESKYYSPDGGFSHPYLSWITRKRMDGFSVITIGVGLETIIDAQTKLIIDTVSDPKIRNDPALSESALAEDGTAAGKSDGTSSANAEPDSGNAGKAAESKETGGLSKVAAQPLSFTVVLALAGTGIIILLVILAIVIRKRLESRRKPDSGRVNDV